jgi:hypothetical protein
MWIAFDERKMSAEPEAFSAVLQEKMAELEVDDAAQAALARDPLEQFRLATQHALVAGGGTPLPRQGHGVYTREPEKSVGGDHRGLDIVS